MTNIERHKDPERRAYLKAWHEKNRESQNAKARAYKKQRRVTDPEWAVKRNAEAAEWRRKNPERLKKTLARYRDTNREKLRIRWRNSGLKKRFGIDIQERDDLLAKQGGVCAACGGSDPGSKKGWHVDHCHNSNKIRGILCQGCNLALGNVKDDIARLQQLIAYLER